MNLEALEQLKKVARTIPTDELNMGSRPATSQSCATIACRLLSPTTRDRSAARMVA
jgi:hypothetical protein